MKQKKHTIGKSFALLRFNCSVTQKTPLQFKQNAFIFKQTNVGRKTKIIDFDFPETHKYIAKKTLYLVRSNKYTEMMNREKLQPFQRDFNPFPNYLY